MTRKTKEDAEAVLARFRARNRERVAACRARKRAAETKKAKKATQRIALQDRKKASVLAARKKAVRAKRRAGRIEANAREKLRRKSEHEAWLIANLDN